MSPRDRQRRGTGRLTWLAGLALAGYGGLVLSGLLAHESRVSAIGGLLLGALLLLQGEAPPVSSGRPALVAGLGLAAAGGCLSYNLALGSTFSVPEVGLLLYGLALLAAAPNLDERVGPVEIDSLVGWSFPVLLGPLLLFALDAVVTGPGGSSSSSWVDSAIANALVAPTALGLELLGTPVQTRGTSLVIEGSGGSLTLGVGLVCAGLYPLVLFAGLLGLHVWHAGLRPPRALGFFLLGTAGLYVLNLARLVAVAEVGHRWGPWWLQTVHAHVGWILYGLFAIGFWVVLAPRLDDRARPS